MYFTSSRGSFVMKHCAALLLSILCVVGVGCASVPTTPASSLFDDRLFAPPTQPIVVGEITALSPEMKRYIETDILPRAARKDLRRVLVDALHNSGELRLDYDGGATRTAAEAFDDRAGNCLSLVLMTAAFAEHLDLTVQYQRVVVEEAWSRDGDLFFASGHVNLSLGPLSRHVKTLSDANQRLTVDFLPAEQIRGQRVRTISKRTAEAMFMNNRAAEELARGALNNAYAWARAAIAHDPSLYETYNTLGVVYLRSGHVGHAERVFAGVLSQEPRNTKVMSNMVRVLRRLGRAEEAKVLGAKLARLEPVRPFQLFDAGIAAMLDGNYAKARELFTQEVERESSYHEFHFWLALANYGLGDLKRAREHMQLARQWSATPDQHNIYTAKLEHIKAVTPR